ncbi:proline dehydrogenase family protein [Acidicapsa ligni]|uniref:proline dehydrogenase family protein n=1 Tax=Acidicapsa ligni TaxID=542300 RepID=UPI0021DF5868|nr:proline dehydrogenase family protein [Acidicapsa ligni]
MPLLRSLLIGLSTNKTLRRSIENSGAGRKLSSRFVAGLEVEDALRAAEMLNNFGMTATLDSLGESVATEAEAKTAAEVYHRLLDAIATRKLSANISVKLTQIGLDLSPDLAYTIAAGLTEHARATSNFLRIDMEGSGLTQVTLDMVRHLHAREEYRGHIGIVIQSYLYRSEADIQQLIEEGIRVRLCKGAYQEPPSVAFPQKTDVDTNYVRLSGILLSSPIYHGLATHDEAMIEAAKNYARNKGVAPDQFEFQMLYGVRRDLQRRLIREGYNVRVYIPFGREWYPYFMRRLAERPANVIFLLKNLVRS